VEKGELPPLRERLPEPPRKLELSALAQKTGRYGGDLRLLMSRAKDVRLMVVYGYARLVGYNARFRLVPDILESIENKGNRIFTLRLRKGHKWSDGAPFTSEDFRYFWEDIANNHELSPLGLDPALLVGGKPPRFEVLDEVTVRYSWDAPNPYFVTALAGTHPLYIYAPSHFLRSFHARYATDRAALERKAKKKGQRSWASLHNRLDSPYKNRVPRAPTLQPWINTTRGPSERFVFVRNPYFHRVDDKGNQLPYIDRVVMSITDSKLIPAKTGAGESDLQARGLKFSDYTFLKQNERRNHYQVNLWQTTKGAHVALFPNLNVNDPVWRAVLRDVRFRRALSMAIDRHEINQVIFQGFAREGNNTVNEKSPLFSSELKTKWASFDLEKANRLLDAIGLVKRNEDHIRLLPDGRPMEMVIETAGESTEESDILELIHDTLLKAGIETFTKPLQREVFRNRIFAGETLVSVWGGLENGVPGPQTSPQELAPTSQQQLQWPRWGQYFQDKGTQGRRPTCLPPRSSSTCTKDGSSRDPARSRRRSGAGCSRSMPIRSTRSV